MEAYRKQFIQKDLFAKHVGIGLSEVGKGHARAEMKIADRHLNGVGVVQGGAIFTLADLAFAAAANSHGTVAMGINVSISYVKAATTGILTAEAREVSVTPRLATYAVEVTDDSGDLIAVFQGMAYRKKDRGHEAV